MENSSDTSSGLVIGAVFSLADTKTQQTKAEQIVNSSKSNQTQVKSHDEEENFDDLIRNSPVPIRHCSVKMDNFIENDLRNKITEACNNSIVKQEPYTETDTTTEKQDIVDSSNNSDLNSLGRPTRKRKPPSALSSEFLFKKDEIREFQKSRKKKYQNEITCQIDRDIVMSVAEKCLPAVSERSENREDIKMVSILPPTLQIKIKDTPVLVDWKSKIEKPNSLNITKITRPQTARTKKKLRTQTQIDEENAKKIKKESKFKKQLKVKKKSAKYTDLSPPHLEPYGGHVFDISKTDSPSSPKGMPPQLLPYEIGTNENTHLVNQHTTSSSQQSKETGTSQVSTVIDRIPCSLTGRMRKPNQQFTNYLLSDIQKTVKPQAKEQKADDKIDKNTTINHESNVVHMTLSPKPQNATRKVVSGSTSQSTNSKLNTAIGELAKIEKTKKFFQLVVGEKIVLIPTDGDNVVPKAFVMDMTAAKPGSSIPKNTQNRLVSEKNQRTFYMKVNSPAGVSSDSSVGQSKSQEIQNIQRNANNFQSISNQQPQTKRNVHSLPNIQMSQPSPQTASRIIFGTKQSTQRISTSGNITRPLTKTCVFTPVQTSGHVVLNQPASADQNIIIPVIPSSGKTTVQPYPTYMVTNSGVNSNHTFRSVVGEKKSLEMQNDLNVSKSPIVVKEEPDNLKDYEEAVAAFKGVPDTQSDTETDDETKSTQAERQSERLGTVVPEVETHVPASENETGERIRKLKEKLRHQQLEVENLRKTISSKSDTSNM